jgi:hypothetical protein
VSTCPSAQSDTLFLPWRTGRIASQKIFGKYPASSSSSSSGPQAASASAIFAWTPILLDTTEEGQTQERYSLRSINNSADTILQVYISGFCQSHLSFRAASCFDTPPFRQNTCRSHLATRQVFGTPLNIRKLQLLASSFPASGQYIPQGIAISNTTSSDEAPERNELSLPLAFSDVELNRIATVV